MNLLKLAGIAAIAANAATMYNSLPDGVKNEVRSIPGKLGEQTKNVPGKVFDTANSIIMNVAAKKMDRNERADARAAANNAD